MALIKANFEGVEGQSVFDWLDRNPQDDLKPVTGGPRWLVFDTERSCGDIEDFIWKFNDGMWVEAVEITEAQLDALL